MEKQWEEEKGSRGSPTQLRFYKDVWFIYVLNGFYIHDRWIWVVAA